MSEKEFAAKVIGHLNQSAAQLPPETVRDLASIRQKALARAAERVSVRDYLGWKMVFSAGALAVACTSYLLMRDQNDVSGLEVHEVEARVMTDELPPKAYLDEGFDNWLKQRPKP